MHNRIDWCVRGYSHGFYNRGQDSAGLLMYEQSSRNTVAYNSVTHGGDGLFLWAGVVLYATVAWRVWKRRSESPPGPLVGDAVGENPSRSPSGPAGSLGRTRPAGGRLSLS